MYIYPTITINGVSSKTIAGLLVTSLPPISKPAQRALVDVIDGRDGDVITPLGFAAYDKPVGIALTKDYDVNEVIKFFNSSGVVVFSNEPDKYYNFAIYEQIDFERLIRFKTATVIFHVQPYKYNNNETPLNFAITSGIPVSVTNSGNTNSKPDIIITGEGVVNLDINGEQVLNIDFGEDEQTYIIDSDAMNAYATENAIKSVVVSIPYEQDGSGDPSPENVRTLAGHSEATVTNEAQTTTSYTLDWSDEAGEVFGGLVDFITGKLSVNKYFMLLTGDASENWTIVNSGTPNYYYALTLPSGTGSAVAGSNISNIFPTANIANNNTLQGCYTTASAVRVRWGEEKTLNEWREFLDSNNMQLLYELLTPQEFLVAPSNIKAVIGSNKISADISNVTVVYKAGGVVHTASGANVTFTLTVNDYERGAFVNRQIVGNYDNIRLKSGNNTLVLTGAATRLIIEKYSRWI